MLLDEMKVKILQYTLTDYLEAEAGNAPVAKAKLNFNLRMYSRTSQETIDSFSTKRNSNSNGDQS